jgi:hypothetical protein
MAEVEISLGAIVQDVDLSVLKGIHRPWIDVQVGIEFLENNTQSTQFEKCSERGGGKAFTERTNHTASDENVLH